MVGCISVPFPTPQHPCSWPCRELGAPLPALLLFYRCGCRPGADRGSQMKSRAGSSSDHFPTLHPYPPAPQWCSVPASPRNAGGGTPTRSQGLPANHLACPRGWEVQRCSPAPSRGAGRHWGRLPGGVLMEEGALPAFKDQKAAQPGSCGTRWSCGLRRLGGPRPG